MMKKKILGLASLASATMLTSCMDPTQVTVSFSGIPLGYGGIKEGLAKGWILQRVGVSMGRCCEKSN